MAGMHQEAAIDGFRLAYERTGSGPAVLLLHGWPGDRTDYRAVVPLVSRAADVIFPDLRGFGESDKHTADPAREYNAAAQARSIAGLIGELGLGQGVLAGYDIGSRIAHAVATDRPQPVRAPLVRTPSAGTWGPSGGTGPAGPRSRAGSPSTPWWRCTGRGAGSPPRSPGTGRAPGRSRPRWPNRSRPRATGSRCPPRCCGRSTTRCSPANGPTGSESSSPTAG